MAEILPATGPVPSTHFGPYVVSEVLGQGATGIVFRGVDPRRDTVVAIKTLLDDELADAEVLRRECLTLSRLDHPGVVRVLASGSETGRPWYAMEYVRGTTLHDYWEVRRHGEARADLIDSLSILRRLCVTLSFLHGEGIVHRDVHPGNIIVRPNGQPVLVDFAFVGAFAAKEGREAIEAGGETMGSIAYLAPEQIWGDFVDARADLYSVGCLLYEALAGAPPFGGDAATILHHHLHTPPATLSSRAPETDPRLVRLVESLLRKDPRERIGFAEDAVAILDDVLGSAEPFPRAAQPYLYRSRFAGRASSLSKLSQRLDASRSGVQCILLIGASGSGKTRLAMELTRVASQREFRVVATECTPPEGTGRDPQGAAFAPLRPLLRLCADHLRARATSPSGHALQARIPILAQYDPTVAEICASIGISTTIVALPPAAARERAVHAIRESLLEIADACPLMLIVDDLQWADELTLALLDSLAEGAQSAKGLAVVATCRSDDLPGALDSFWQHGTVARMHVDPLAVRDVGQIVGDMLALQSPPEALVEFVASESQGNPFFVAEYLRTAVSSGMLTRSRDGVWAPSHGPTTSVAYRELGLPRSIHTLIERRLRALSDAARQLVVATSVLGRESAVETLRELVDLDEATFNSASDDLVRRQILRRGSSELRFEHDKFREVTYAAIESTQRRALHARAGEVLERFVLTSPDAAASYATLGRHFADGGANAKAAPYLGLAGEHALDRGAASEARTLLRQALALGEEVAPPLEIGLKARWLRLLGAAEAGIELERGIDRSVEALELLGHPCPRGPTGWTGILLRQLFTQTVHRWLPARARPAAYERRLAVEASLASTEVATASMFRFELTRGIASALRSVNLAEKAGEPARASLPYAQLGYIAGGARLHRIARHYFDLSHEIHDADVDASAFGIGLYFHAMYEMGFARWRSSEALARRAFDLLNEIGNAQAAEVAATILSNSFFFEGQIRESKEWAVRVLRSAEPRGYPQHTAWALMLIARADLLNGSRDEALQNARRSYELLVPTQDFVSLVMCEGTLAHACAVAGDVDGAAQVLDSLRERTDRRGIVPLAQCLDGYGAAAHVRQLLGSLGHPGGNLSAQRRAVADLNRFRRLFPMATPSAFRHRARLALAQRRTRLARHWLRRALRSARALEMPVEEGRCLWELAAVDGSGPGRDEQRSAAEEILRSHGCTPHDIPPRSETIT